MSVVISGMAVVSCLGTDTGDFTAGLPAGRTPGEPAALARVSEQDDEAFATSRRVRLRERSSVLAVGTVTKLLAGLDLSASPPARRGIVLGSAMASIDSYMIVSKGSLSGAKPYFVDHNRMPPGIMNYTSGQAAVKFDLHGPNVTVTAGRASGLTALTCGRRLVAAGRADIMLAGAFEEVTERRLRIEAAAGRSADGIAAGEGACVFALETADSARRADRPVLAELLATTAGYFATEAEAGATLTRTVERALRQAGVTPAEIRTVVRGTPGPGRLAGQESTVLAALAPDARIVDPASVVGDTWGASSAFGVAAAVAVPEGGLTLVTSIDPDGQVAACLVRPPAASPGDS
ncbi:beta-ketoacyl synthase N-terminal-like domain-containing protein [Micromonospora sp. RTGN7]|uniref:beta-ketoacyl synthase N-terminal-like domain-containing protein n=1 Tax=Micromonospora sp. RTGN7 TaxID=3016526 RepID=UPI0029FF1C11|nr:beta-ketoacyl synthase N-terminal-like domain-containing protein [Micromonospora sp. RTGN7]